MTETNSITTTKTILEQEKSLQEAKNQKIQELLAERGKLEAHYVSSKKQISADLKALGHHITRSRKGKAKAEAK